MTGPLVVVSLLAAAATLAAALLGRRLRSRTRELTNIRSRADQVASDGRAREELLAAAVYEAPAATLLLDERGTVRFANAAARAIFFAGANPTDASLAEVLRNAPEALRRALGGDATELVALEQDGEREVLHVNKRAYRAAGIGETLTVVTAQPLTSELLREEVAAYKRLVRVLGHELNNSLAPVASLASTGQRLLATGSHQELPSLLQTIAERVEHLRSFLQGYGAIARLPQPRRQQVPIERVLSRMGTLFPGVVVHTTSGAAFVDEGQIEQVLVNLLKNALEAGSPPDLVELTATVEADGDARFMVSDRGQGLSEEALASALVPFFSTKPGGAGLGLATSREIVESHGGRMRIRGRQGGGAQVVVRLPGTRGKARDELSWTVTR